MKRVPTSYARSADGQIAYELDPGEGPVVVALSGSMSGTLIASQPLFEPAHRRWRGFSRLLFIDPRGTGKSDPLPHGQPAAVDDAVADIVAVLDHAGIERAWLLGFHGGAALAIVLAASRPERVEGLILINGWARLIRDEEIPWGIPARLSDSIIRSHEEQYGTGMWTELAAPRRAAEPEVRDLFVSLEGGSSRSQATLLTRLIQELDVRDELDAVRAPTLVVHATTNLMAPVEHGRYLANRIAGARYFESDAIDHAYHLGDFDEVLDEVETFITGVRPLPHADRVFAAVLFTDIVGATKQATAAGDRAWRSRLDLHDRLTREVIEGHGGRVIKTTGDGVLALFDAPSRALRAGLDVIDVLQERDLPVRVGLHAGEVEQRGDDVAGIAVHIAQRVCGCAGAGELLASRGVPDLVLGQPFTFTEAGTHALKGVSGTWSLWRACPLEPSDA